AILINEVAWAGTGASANDEWIELHNPGAEAIDLPGWLLGDGGDISIPLGGTLPPYAHFLLERTDDTTVADVAADQIYAGALANTGEVLTLRDPTGRVIDTANADGGAWPGGDAASRATMERRGSLDVASNWGTAAGPGQAHDAAGDPILGTPRAPNLTLAPTATASPQPTAPSPGAVWINEVAWAGTGASSSDEWIELHNPGPSAIDIHGWRLSDGGDVSISLAGTIAPYGFFLLERTDDSTVSDIGADQVYAGALSNSGERLTLTDAAGTTIDTANGDGGGWPAGDEGSRRSMERRAAGDVRGSWGTFTGYFGTGHDASNRPIPGTPRAPNSILFPTPIPTWIPGKVVINEVLPRPHYDWEGTGGVTSGDEYIELLNLGPGQVRLGGWSLDDVGVGGSSPYILPNLTLGPGGYAVFFRTRSRIALNDRGDTVRLEAPDGRLIDKIVYLRGSAVNLAYGRLPDGSGRLTYCLWPTPGRSNELFHECRPRPPVPPPRLAPVRPRVVRTYFLDCHAGGRWSRPEQFVMRC
ncbi:MAG: lamin tail domain-containing protein, partial [Anaerolineales bacterium]